MFLADLHIHSNYSRATSRDCVPEYLDLWARRKGIDLIGTGDFTHPAWREELREKLAPAEEGLFTLKGGARLEDAAALGQRRPRFVVSGEISSIYKKNGRVRKVHNLILLPGLEEAEKLSKRLELVGNLHSDGRPILGLDSRDLLEITLECCPEAIFIPAHIWTPHFSLFGAFSGFDTIEECFGDLTPQIHALETGLSSDPPMNWRLSALDGYTLVSNSDAHSPSKLGREANLFDTELSYPALSKALGGQGARGFAGTIEFFPAEGKYHFDGHRNCGQCLSPARAEAAGGVCPVCGGRLTIGVSHRVEQLADRPEGFTPSGAKPFESLVPLPEVIAASTGFTAACGRVRARYESLLEKLGAEFFILREAPLEEIGRVAGPCVMEGVRRLRDGEITVSPGYDGAYGKVQILSPDEIEALAGQLSFFGAGAGKERSGIPAEAPIKKTVKKAPGERMAPEPAAGALDGLNDRQLRAATAAEPAVAVIAGPGTGKTKTLVSRIAWLVREQGARPAGITAVTFTNKAAGELRSRLERQLGKRAARAMTIGTFHAICLRLLSRRTGGVTLVDAYEARALAAELLAEHGEKLSAERFLQTVSAVKNGAQPPDDLPCGLLEAYREKLAQNGVLDFDDLLLEALALFEGQAEDKPPKNNPFSHLLVDEFQDINAVQYRLVRAWSRGGAGLFVIGDPDQSIYGFRGSDARCFERFVQDYPGAARIPLTRNYRSTPEILRCALPVISRNPGPAEGRALEAQREGGAPVRLLAAPDDFSEAVFVAKEINRMVGGIDMLDAHGQRKTEAARGFSDIAVLYRTHRQAEVLEKCLTVEGIPYLVAGRDKTLADGWVRAALCFFRALLNPDDRVSLRGFLRALPGAEPERRARWAALVERFSPRAQKDQPQKLLAEWAEELGCARAPAIERLLCMAALHNGLAEFLENLALGQEADIARSGARRYLPDAVTLMTLHGAKGLEFPVVFLCGARRGLLPLDQPGRAANPEEERRLFYVGMTRAKEELLLLTGPDPSPFLGDLPSGGFERGTAGAPRRPSGGKQLSLFD